MGPARYDPQLEWRSLHWGAVRSKGNVQPVGANEADGEVDVMGGERPSTLATLACVRVRMQGVAEGVGVGRSSEAWVGG